MPVGTTWHSARLPMRAPIGIRIRSRRQALGLGQAELARRAGISASYLNLIEANKRDVAGALLNRIATELGIEIGTLTGEAEHRLIGSVEEAFSDRVLADLGLDATAARDLVATAPGIAAVIARLHRAYVAATADADTYAQRLRADPLVSQSLHRLLSGITAIRSSAEILDEVPDLAPAERRRFLATVTGESGRLAEGARTLAGQFDSEAAGRRRASPLRELDDFIFAHDNYFPRLEEVAGDLSATIPAGDLAAGIGDRLAAVFGVTVRRTTERLADARGFPGEYRYEGETRTLWFHAAATAATRQLQLARLYGELSAADAIAAEVEDATLVSPTAKRLAYRALGSYLAAAIVFPYDRFLETARSVRYDIDTLQQAFGASFEQVAHRLVTLRRPGAAGVPFGFLRSDPAGRLTKQFPLPGLLLPYGGHACPLWTIYEAFRTPDRTTRQLVRFSDGSRYLFIARAVARSRAHYRDTVVPTSIMLACDALEADQTIYADGLDLDDGEADVKVGPACRLCPRHDCPSRQEEAPGPGGLPTAIRSPLVPGRFDVGEP